MFEHPAFYEIKFLTTMGSEITAILTLKRSVWTTFAWNFWWVA